MAISKSNKRKRIATRKNRKEKGRREDFIGSKVSSISTSPEREDTILVEEPFSN